MSTLDTQIRYFKVHQPELAEEHHGKFVLIHGESLKGFFDSELKAYTTAKRSYEAGTFLIRKCLKSEEESPQVFHSRVG